MSKSGLIKNYNNRETIIHNVRHIKVYKISIILLCLLILFSGTAFAKQITVKKIIPNNEIKTGESVSISLEFDNPFNKSVPVTIQDNNVLGNNGLEIQCYEYTIPGNPRTGISYDFPIEAFSPGDFTLDQVIVTYTNPETGKQESVKSEPVRISIKQGKTTGQQQGITKIYNCGGVSMRSTSMSSSSSASISISSGSQQAGQNYPQPTTSPEDIRQQAQDMQNIKQEMERQQQEQEKMEQNTEDIKRLMQYIEGNETFKQMNKTLSGKGFNISARNIGQQINTSSFEYSYRDRQGRNASISGNVTDAGEIKDIILKEPEPPFPYWIFAVLLAAATGIYIFMKSRTKGKTMEPVKPISLIDPTENALSILENAIIMFNNGRQKEAYMEASNAVRSYFKGKSGINELTSDEIIRSIRGSKEEGYLQDVKECFMLCDLVKFAKYETNEKDFSRVVEYARRIIV